MIWAKRQFADATYAPYQGKMEALLMSSPGQTREFIMFSMDTEKAGVSDYYVGVPNELHMRVFDGFAPVKESELPKVIDTVLVVDENSPEFKRLFKRKSI